MSSATHWSKLRILTSHIHVKDNFVDSPLPHILRTSMKHKRHTIVVKRSNGVGKSWRNDSIIGKPLYSKGFVKKLI